MGSAPGTTTIKRYVTQQYGTKFKPELSQYLHASLIIPITASILKSTKQGFLKTWPGLTEKLIKGHLDKSRNTTMGLLHMRRQGLKSTKDKPPDTEL